MRQYLTPFFYVAALILVGAFLWSSNGIAEELAEQERKSAKVWAEAIKLFTSPEEIDPASLTLVAQVLEGNTTIPVILCNEVDSILMFNNINLQNKDSLQYLHLQLQRMKNKSQMIEVQIDDKTIQHLYYNDSNLQRKLALFPYIQLLVMAVFVTIIYFSIKSARKAEQDRVWVGLSKETAHQLGTPISSLLAWIELLRVREVDSGMLIEMDKDTQRLKTIAERFSKVGSQPQLKDDDLVAVLAGAVDYMSRRISTKVVVNRIFPSEPVICKLSASLFEWVIENLTKNAIDAIEGAGTLSFTLSVVGQKAVLDVADSGRGMTKQQMRRVFSPGYTTKARGWGLGLTLARRIISEYHGGNISILNSELGKGTIFRIELPLEAL